MNRTLRHVSVVALFVFALLLGSITWTQFVTAGSLNADPRNSRTIYDRFGRDRGPLLVDGKPVAESVPSDDNYQYQRRYPQAELYAPVTGYYSLVYGSSGLEKTEDELLSGTSDQLFYRRISDLVSGRQPSGASVELTIDPRAQQAAWDALGDQRGAVVALDPKTGDILAMVSKPSYDPNQLATHTPGDAQAAWRELNGDPAQPMLNRAISALYPPGSTFKLVTAAAALEAGDTPQTVLDGPASLPLPDTKISLDNDDHQPCGPNDQVSLLTALQISCNTAFASLGLQLGAGALDEQAAKFGYGQTVDTPLTSAASSFPDNPNRPQTAMSAIGQFDVKTTPLQVAMTTAAIANGGEEMTPNLIRTVRAPDLTVLSQGKQSVFSHPVSSHTASDLTTMMRAVVDHGTGTAAQIPGVAVAGKTGTAQHAQGAAPHAWFTGFAPADNPKVAVAVVVEDGGRAGNEAFGGTVAAPIAKAVMQAVINP